MVKKVVGSNIMVPALLGMGLCVGSPWALAQAIPDAGSLLRENQRDSAPPPALPRSVAPLNPEPEAHRAAGETRFVVKRFKIEGAQRIPDAELQALLARWLDRPIGFAELEQAAQSLVDAYRGRGWLARAQLPPQDISDGTVIVRLLEARLGSVRVVPSPTKRRVESDWAADFLTTRQNAGEPLRLESLDRAINLLNDAPGVAASVALAPGRDAGETDLVLTLQDRPAWTGAAQFDDLGSRSTGSARLSASASLDDPSGSGDQLTGGASASQGSRYLQAGYTRAVGSDGLRLGVAASAMQYHLLKEFAPLQARGEAQTLTVSVAYPLIRSAYLNLAATASLDDREYRDKANGQQTDRKTAHVATFALHGDAIDAFGSDLGGYTLWGVALATGRLDLAGDSAYEAADLAGPRTEGGFGKLGFNLARLQRLSANTALWAALSGQVATRNLDSSEKFSLGGAYGVRAYPALEAQGDSGWLGTLELRHAIAPGWQANAFVDAGGVQRQHAARYAGASAVNRLHLAGAGLGLDWSRPGDFSVRATLARRIGSNPLANPSTGADSDGSHDTLRFWLVATRFF